jgi:hypothetical protein
LIAHFVDGNNEEIQMMRFGPSILKSPLLAVIAASAFSQSSFAATILDPNFTATAGGISTTTNVPYVPAATSSSSYGHNFTTNLTGVVPNTAYEFYDDYLITIDGSSVSSITATINLGGIIAIDGLSVRLFSWDNTVEQSGGVTTGSLPLNATMLQSWLSVTSTTQVATIDKTDLVAGTYVLQVRGNVSGIRGGNYVGTLNVAPVPLPAALPLLMSGLGLFGGLFGRRRTAV